MEITPLDPLHFFAIGFDIQAFKGKKGQDLLSSCKLPDVASLFEYSPFAAVYLSWSEEGIFVDVDVENKNVKMLAPDFRQGDSVELFFDTRDRKETSYCTSFCHHFVFLPEIPESGKEQAFEMTHFRGDDRHELTDPSHLFVDVERKRGSLRYHIFISKEALWGYDPHIFKKLGFTYRINRYREGGSESQYFSVSSEAFQVEHHPSLWASGQLA